MLSAPAERGGIPVAVIAIVVVIALLPMEMWAQGL
jgi:hypothetical protein